jgi:hypothetical protein
MINKIISSKNEPPNENVNENGNLIDDDNDYLSIIQKIKTDCNRIMIYIDDKIARLFYNSNIPFEWMKSPSSFFEFCKLKVDISYSDKPDEEKRLLFFNAVQKWENLRQEYPIWKKKQKKEEQERKKRELILSAENQKPMVCKCGEKLNSSLFCHNCRGFYEFNSNTLTYDYMEGLSEDDSLVKELKKIMGEKNNSHNKGE